MATTRHITGKRLSCRHTDIHTHIHNVRAPGPQSGGPFTRTDCPLIHLQTWKSSPASEHHAKETKERKTEATWVGKSLSCLSPSLLEVGSRGLGRPISPAQLLPAPNLGAFSTSHHL